MKTVVKTSTLKSVGSEYLVLPIFLDDAPKKVGKSKKPNPWSGMIPLSQQTITKLDGHFAGALSERITQYMPKLAAGSRFELPRPRGTLRVSGLHDKARIPGDVELDEWRKLGGDALKAARNQKAKKVAIVIYGMSAEATVATARAIAEGAYLSVYEYRRYKTDAGKKTQAPFEVAILELWIDGPVPAGIAAHVEKARVLGETVTFARDLVNAAPSDLPPSGLVQAAKKIAASAKGKVRLKILDRKALSKMGANALLAVAKGSDEPPFLIHLSYRGSSSRSAKKRVVLVGKGVTFDSGGLSLKSRPGMEDMKCDMAGAACVLGLLAALTRLKGAAAVPHDVDIIIPTAENMVNGRSVKPGDVVRAVNGKTIEILNTDAEGRLLLADAFGYAATLKADIMLDFATLTGAVVAAVGEEYAGLFCDDAGLRAKLLAAGAEAGEKAWWLPLATEYRPLIESSVADIKNHAGAGPGAITAALFLKEFVPNGVRWGHFDIAGPAYVSKSNEYIPKGGTGYGVSTLLRFLEKL